MIAKGDKVRFLNDIGGGVVARIVGETAFVEDADGFEIPAKLSQIVLVQKKEGAAAVVPSRSSKEKAEEVVSVAKSQNEPMVYLALLQGDKPGSVSGDFRLYIVNDTPFQLSYIICGQGRTEGIFELMYQGGVSANQLSAVDKLPGRMLEGKSLVVQFLMFSPSGQFEMQHPVTADVKIRPVRLLQDGSFAKSAYFNEKALLVPLMKSEVHEKIELLKGLHSKEDNATVQKVRPKSNQLPKRGDIVEIDLHIHELIDDSKGLSNSEMLKIQMDKFKQTIDDHQNIKGVRLVFIHGVGNGTLKNEIVRALKTQYKNLYYQDASFKEYGYGATMVTI